ncbi:MAG: hypothetical protein DWQ28_13515 [Proteobacteria bacterium]|nr:MAG: hypothetical protein DWQ28_13515 [Pseudomonadota bacterium]REK60293.1 MAG: hypothetical protein DWQ49_06400 [Bacteroidota bacterium]
MRYIFDLDHTVIDSSHRQATRPDGSLDLDHWREHSTPAMIAADTLLPLANEWRKVHRKGAKIVVCTARVMGPADYRYLADHGLFADCIISRREGDTTPDDLLKLRGLKRYARDQRLSWRGFCATSMMFDDNLTVIDTLTKNGITCHNAKPLNEALS